MCKSELIERSTYERLGLKCPGDFAEDAKCIEDALQRREWAEIQAYAYNKVKMLKEIQRLTARNAELEARARWVPVSDKVRKQMKGRLCVTSFAPVDRERQGLSLDRLYEIGNGVTSRGFREPDFVMILQPPEVNTKQDASEDTERDSFDDALEEFQMLEDRERG